MALQTPVPQPPVQPQAPKQSTGGGGSWDAVQGPNPPQPQTQPQIGPPKPLLAKGVIGPPNPVSVSTQAKTALQGHQNTLSQAQQGMANQKANKQAAAQAAVQAKAQTAATPPAAPTAKDIADNLSAGFIDKGTTTTQNATATTNNFPALTQNQISSVFGGNINGVTQNADGTWTATPDALSRLGQNSSDPQAAGKQYLDTMSQNQQAIEAHSQKVQTQLDQISNGTFPLTNAQQSLLAATQQENDANRASLEAGNAAYVAGITALGIRQGLDQGSPTIQMGNIQRAIAKGANDVASLDAKAAVAVANLQDGFQKNDLSAIQASANEYDNMMTLKQDVLKQMYQDAYNASKDARDFAQKALDTAFTQTMQSATLSNTEKKNAFDQYIAQANLTNTQKAQAEKTWKDQQDVSIAQSKATIESATKNDPLGVLPGNPKTVNDLVHGGIASTLSSGAAYVDLSAIAGTPSKDEAAKIARAAGLPTIATPADAQSLSGLENARKGIDQASTLFQQVAPKDFGQRIGDAITQGGSQFFDTPFGQQVKAYQGFKNFLSTTLIPELSGLKRVNTVEIEQLANALPNMDPKSTDTWAGAQLKLNNLMQLIDNKSSTLLGGKMVYGNLQDYAGSLNDTQRASAQATVQQMQQDHPNWTNDDILQILQGHGNVDLSSLGGSSGGSGDSGFNSVGGDTNQATSVGTGMRTDRNNNPTAMTTDVARTMGLVEGKDYVKSGDTFAGGKYQTAKLLGDPVATTIKAIDNGGFQTASGKPRWTYIDMPKSQWDGLSYDDKKQVIASMYKNEGGSKLSKLFA